MLRKRHLFLGALPVGIAFLAVGCGGNADLGTVKGKISLDGQPLVGAQILFQPKDGRPSTGVTDTEGQYELLNTRDSKGALIGAHTVRITMPTEDEDGNPLSDRRVLPAKYNRESALTAEVKAGSNTFDFDLSSTD